MFVRVAQMAHPDRRISSDLHALLPPGFSSSQAKGVWRNGAFIYVVGWVNNEVAGRQEALMWVKATYTAADMNCDGAVDNFDIDPFVLVLTQPAEYRMEFPSCNPKNGDVNQDGGVDNFDIDLFVACLTSGGGC